MENEKLKPVTIVAGFYLPILKTKAGQGTFPDRFY
jgi:hypothetical protein